MVLFNLPNPLIKMIFRFVDLGSRYHLTYVDKLSNNLIPLPSIEDLYQFMRNMDNKIKIRYINEGCNGYNSTEELSDIPNSESFIKNVSYKGVKDVELYKLYMEKLIGIGYEGGKLSDIPGETNIDYENIRKLDIEVYNGLIDDLKDINGVPEHPIINPKDIDLDMSEFLPMLKQSYLNYRFVLCCYGGDYETSYFSFRFNIGSRDWYSEIQIDDYFEGDDEHLPRFNPWEWIDLVNFDADEDSEMWLINCCKESEYYGRIHRYEHQRGDKAREFHGVSLKSFISNFPLYLKNKRYYRQYLQEKQPSKKDIEE